MSVLAALRVVLGLETGPFQKGATQAQMEAQKLVKSVERTGKQIMAVGAGITAGLTVPFTALMTQAIPAARESAEALGQVTAALTTMGPAAGRTAEQLQKQADQLMKMSTFDDDDILRNVTANMLTFGNVTGQSFDRAQLAVVNMATRLKMDLQSATILVGKALNDPVKGMAALARAGIQLTEAQKDTIKSMVETGNAAGAQKIMLAELERQFGGSAEAMRAASPDVALRQSWDTLKETLGKMALDILPKILPPITRMVDAFSNLSPTTQAVVVGVLAVGAALGPLLIGVGGIVTAFAAAAPAIIAFGSAFATFAGVLVTGAIPAIGSLIVALAPILVPLAAVAAAVAAVWYAFEHWDEIKPVLDRAWQAVKLAVAEGIIKVFGWLNDKVAAVSAVFRNTGAVIELIVIKLYTAIKTWVLDKLNAIWDGVGEGIARVKGFFHGLWDAVVGHSYIPDMVDGIAAHMGRLDAVMVNPAKTATERTKQAFEKLGQDVQSLMDRLFPDARKLADFRNELGALDKGIKAGGAGGYSAEQLSAARDELLRTADKDVMDRTALPMRDFVKLYGEQITPDMQKIYDQIAEVGKSATSSADTTEAANVRVVKSFKDMADATLQSLSNMVGAIKGGGFMNIMSSVLSFGLQLGSIGAFGKNVAANINRAKIPAYAGGTNFHPGGMALVGEDGPELVTMPRGSSVTPNGKFGGQSTVQIVPSPYFDVVVDGRVMRAAPGIAMVGADAGSKMAGAKSAWQNEWTLR